MDETASILSTGERDVARRLRAGQSVAEIAEAREVSTEAVEQARDRIQEKTARAWATLAQSPVAAETAADLDEETRARLREVLDDPGRTADSRDR